MSDDFSVVQDLRSFRDEVSSSSPAHASPGKRRWELDTWKDLGIRTRSYATWVPRATGAEEKILDRLLPAVKFLSRAADHVAGPVNAAAGLWPLLGVSLPALIARVGVPAAALPAVLTALNAEPSLLFDLFQAVCADRHGHFRNPNDHTPNGVAPFLERFGSAERVPTAELSPKDSDGVVNTLSMCWPHDPESPDDHAVKLVKADHGDIIGHYVRKDIESPLAGGRKSWAYDFFPSGSGFDDRTFSAVWHDVFDFCTRD